MCVCACACACVCLAIVIQNEELMRRIILSSVTWSDYHIFFTLSQKRHYLKQKCVFWVSLQFLSEIFLTVRRLQRDIIINVHRSSYQVFVILLRFLITLESSRLIFEKYWNITFHKNPSPCSRVVPCGETDRHDKADSRLSQFCETA